MQSIQNLGLALIAMAAGTILDTRGYLILEVFFCTCVCSECFCVCVSVLVLLGLWVTSGFFCLSFLDGGGGAVLCGLSQRSKRSQSQSQRWTLAELTPMSAFGLRNRYPFRLGVQDEVRRYHRHCSRSRGQAAPRVERIQRAWRASTSRRASWQGQQKDGNKDLDKMLCESLQDPVMTADISPVRGGSRWSDVPCVRLRAAWVY
ncbi:unnamed protein product [Tetraodon nigroviridis]|uniref:(spotted green pufferfish) hypothetical protein n=1 Tax=Tetraodon nigroviridis TaxID=99883 RepID=Q4SPP1_TETNG|nr:unnamed protein product [Tetraodon nigroviridis]